MPGPTWHMKIFVFASLRIFSAGVGSSPPLMGNICCFVVGVMPFVAARLNSATIVLVSRSMFSAIAPNLVHLKRSRIFTAAGARPTLLMAVRKK